MDYKQKKIIVCILPDKEIHDKSIVDIFQNETFSCIEYGDENKDHCQNVSDTLQHCKNEYPTSDVLIVKAGTCTNTHRDDIEKIINNCCDAKFDLLYLCKWMDKCQLYTNKETLGNCKGFIADTYSPHGLQCVLFRSKGRNYALECKNVKEMDEHLHQGVYSNKIKAKCLVPNLFDFNVAHATSNKDFMKLQECEPIIYHSKSDSEPFNTQGFIFCLLLVILIVGLVYYFVGRKNRYK